ATNLHSDVDFISVSNTKRQLAFISVCGLNFFHSSSSQCCPEPFFIMKMHGKSFQGAQMDKTLNIGYSYQACHTL
ncbi:unnamed protein product, partial [Staurois parvus]